MKHTTKQTEETDQEWFDAMRAMNHPWTKDWDNPPRDIAEEQQRAHERYIDDINRE